MPLDPKREGRVWRITSLPRTAKKKRGACGSESADAPPYLCLHLSCPLPAALLLRRAFRDYIPGACSPGVWMESLNHLAISVHVRREMASRLYL